MHGHRFNNIEKDSFLTFFMFVLGELSTLMGGSDLSFIVNICHEGENQTKKQYSFSSNW